MIGDDQWFHDVRYTKMMTVVLDPERVSATPAKPSSPSSETARPATISPDHRPGQERFRQTMKSAILSTMTRYAQSESLLQAALELFPTGTQTAMKSAVSFPVGVSPLFVQRAQGSRLWDVDGNEYVDFVGALGPITLGYNDPDVAAAVREQLDIGALFSLSHPLEWEVARHVAGTRCRQCRGERDERLGGRKRSNPLHALVPANDRHDGGKALTNLKTCPLTLPILQKPC